MLDYTNSQAESKILAVFLTIIYLDLKLYLLLL